MYRLPEGWSEQVWENHRPSKRLLGKIHLINQEFKGSKMLCLEYFVKNYLKFHKII